MDDEFEFQYADELDAMDEIVPDFDGPNPKGKKSLDFSTPSTKAKNALQYISSVRDIHSPDDSICCEPLNTSAEGSPVGKKNTKRKISTEELGELSENLKEKGQQKKKQRLCEAMNWESFPGISDQSDARYIKENLNVIGNEKMSKNSTIPDDDLARQKVQARIPSADYIPVTDNTGRRFYLVLKEEVDRLEEVYSMKKSHHPSQLLSIPMTQLKMQLQDKKCEDLLHEPKRLDQHFESSVCPDYWSFPEVEDLGKTLPESAKNETAYQKLPSALWVDRYSPGRYTELLSDEATNRVVLKWLKLWDVVVFGKEKKVKDVNETKKNKNQIDLTAELDHYDRPHFKAVLLSGPPGLGKTTLAHVISKHAGYNVVEINASDDRSAEVFKQKLDAATQMKSVLGADPKPNCLIIDEIDGAPIAAVNILLTLLKHSENVPTNKKKKRPQILMRPIICICNDLYVPALRQLRQNSLVVTFPPTLSTQLAGRLMEVCRKENLLCDLTTLLALCEKADNDIRSCLNTLQFVKSQSTELSLHTITSMSLGQKDAHKSLFSTWKHIFKIPKAKRKNYINPHERTNENQQDLDTTARLTNTSLSARFKSTLEVTIAAGESEKILQGLFENYLEAKVKDPRLQFVVKGTEWLEFVDLINKDILHNQNYTFLKYTSFLPVMFHLLFAVNNPHRILYPQSQFENVTKLQKSENLITTLINDVCPLVRKNLNVTIIVTELLHPFLDIIKPTLRPVNTQLYSTREKEELNHLIQVMIAYNLSYRQERSVDGQYSYIIEPNIDDLIKYPGMKLKKQLTYAAKQLVSREIELEKMRRSERMEELNRQIVKSRNLKMKYKKYNDVAVGDTTETIKTLVPNHKRQNLEVKSIKEEKEYVDFFGRKVKRTIPEAKRELKKEEKIGGEVWFKFKEGFSNAVRRTVKVQDFL